MPEAPLGGHSTQRPLLPDADEVAVPAAVLWPPADVELPPRPPEDEPDPPAATVPVDPPVPVELEFAVLAVPALDVLVPVVVVVVPTVVIVVPTVVIVVVDGCRIGSAAALPLVG